MATHALVHAIDGQGLALIESMGLVRPVNLPRRHVPADPTRVEREPVFKRSLLPVMADHGHASVAGPERVVNNGLVDGSVGQGLYCEPVRPFVEGVSDLSVLGIGDRPSRIVDRREILPAKKSTSVATVVLVAVIPRVARSAPGFADERSRFGLQPVRFSIRQRPGQNGRTRWSDLPGCRNVRAASRFRHCEPSRRAEAVARGLALAVRCEAMHEPTVFVRGSVRPETTIGPGGSRLV